MDKPGAHFIEPTGIFKSLYHKTFLPYFNFLLKRNHTNFYPLDYITKLQ